MMRFIERTVVAEMEAFYKRYVTRTKTAEYKTWESSDQYVKDLTAVKNKFIEDCVDGFYSQCEEVISVEEYDDVKQRYVDYLQVYSSLSNKPHKIEFLCGLYDKQDYYPNFNYRWLYDTFDERIIKYD